MSKNGPVTIDECASALTFPRIAKSVLWDGKLVSVCQVNRQLLYLLKANNFYAPPSYQVAHNFVLIKVTSESI